MITIIHSDLVRVPTLLGHWWGWGHGQWGLIRGVRWWSRWNTLSRENVSNNQGGPADISLVTWPWTCARSGLPQVFPKEVTVTIQTTNRHIRFSRLTVWVESMVRRAIKDRRCRSTCQTFWTKTRGDVTFPGSRRGVRHHQWMLWWNDIFRSISPVYTLVLS